MGTIRDKRVTVQVCALLLLALPAGSYGALTKNGTKEELLRKFEPANRLSGILQLTGLERSGNTCVYSYGLESNISSKQPVTGVALGMSDRSGQVLSPGKWVTNAEISLFVLDNKRKEATGSTAVYWMTLKAGDDLQPGKRIDGFKVSSDRLPGIKPFWLTGRSGKSRPDGTPSAAEKKVLAELLDPFNNAFDGKTIGPDELITEKGFNPEYQVERLYRLVKDSEKLGWISDGKTAAKLRKIVSDAIMANKTGDRVSAGRSLGYFEAEIGRDEAEKRNFIRNDARLMLRINSEWIRGVLSTLKETKAVPAKNSKKIRKPVKQGK
jgi:hypothetical protein